MLGLENKINNIFIIIWAEKVDEMIFKLSFKTLVFRQQISKFKSLRQRDFRRQHPWSLNYIFFFKSTHYKIFYFLFIQLGKKIIIE